MASGAGNGSSSEGTISEAEGNAYLPGGEAGGAHEVSARLYLHVLVVLRTDLTQLEGGAHLTVELVLLLGGGAMGETYTKAFSTSMQSNTKIY